MKIGVLALQGSFREHIDILGKLNVEGIEIRQPHELDQIDALIIPGGESTTILQLLETYDFDLKGFKKPMFGTCAGCIILAKLGLISIKINRNAYGTQLYSFVDEVELALDGKKHMFHSIFIRAPKILSCSGKVDIIGMHDGSAVLVRQDNILAATFHPELTDDPWIHKIFLDMIESRKEKMK